VIDFFFHISFRLTQPSYFHQGKSIVATGLFRFLLGLVSFVVALFEGIFLDVLLKITFGETSELPTKEVLHQQHGHEA
jgi:hypothetical protein